MKLPDVEEQQKEIQLFLARDSTNSKFYIQTLPRSNLTLDNCKEGNVIEEKRDTIYSVIFTN